MVYFVLIRVNFDVKFQEKNQEKCRHASKSKNKGAKQREQSTTFQGAKISHGGIQHAKMHSKVRNPKSKISHTLIQGAKIFAPCKTPSWHMIAISYNPNQFLHSANQGAKISHDTVQGAKIIVQCANSLNVSFAHHYSRCENFRTVRNKVRKFRTV